MAKSMANSRETVAAAPHVAEPPPPKPRATAKPPPLPLKYQAEIYRRKIGLQLKAKLEELPVLISKAKIIFWNSLGIALLAASAKIAYGAITLFMSLPEDLPQPWQDTHGYRDIQGQAMWGFILSIFLIIFGQSCITKRKFGRFICFISIIAIGFRITAIPFAMYIVTNSDHYGTMLGCGAGFVMFLVIAGVASAPWGEFFDSLTGTGGGTTAPTIVAHSKFGQPGMSSYNDILE